jgi:hypothetical protein
LWEVSQKRRPSLQTLSYLSPGLHKWSLYSIESKKMTVLWDAAPCSLVSTYETSVNYQTTRRNNPENSHLHTRCRENLKSQPKVRLKSTYNDNSPASETRLSVSTMCMRFTLLRKCDCTKRITSLEDTSESKKCEISGSHGGGYEDDFLLGCCVVLSGTPWW